MIRIPLTRCFLLTLALAACSATARERDTTPAAAASRPPDSIAPAIGTAQPGEGAAIARIRLHFMQIEREHADYQCRSLDLYDFSAEGGEVEACYSAGQLRRLNAIYYGEGGRMRENYYFWNDTLEFLFRQDEDYSAHLSGKVVRSREDRFYWDGGRLIRWLNPAQVAEDVNSATAVAEASKARALGEHLARCAANLSDSSCTAPDS
jgi:hypothetical protein